MSTARARSRLGSTGKVRILVENTVLYHAVTHETGWVSTGAKSLGPHVRETGYAARMPVLEATSGLEPNVPIRPAFSTNPDRANAAHGDFASL